MPSPARGGRGASDDHAEIRQQFIALIRKRARGHRFTRNRPTDVRPGEIVDPESGLPLTHRSMWWRIVRFLEEGVPLRGIELDKPPGETAWTLRGRLGPGTPVVYVKLQIIGSCVLLRSFHISEYSHD